MYKTFGSQLLYHCLCKGNIDSRKCSHASYIPDQLLPSELMLHKHGRRALAGLGWNSASKPQCSRESLGIIKYRVPVSRSAVGPKVCMSNKLPNPPIRFISGSHTGAMRCRNMQLLQHSVLLASLVPESSGGNCAPT